MGSLTSFRANSYSQCFWLCDNNLAQWTIGLLRAYGNSICDIGIGTGYMIPFYCDVFSDIYGVDPSSHMLDKISEANHDCVNKCEIVNGTAENLPFADNIADISFSKSSLHHFDDINKSLMEMKRVAKRLVAVMEVIVPSDECLPFLHEVLLRKERGRDKSTVFTERAIYEHLSKLSDNVNMLHYDQYIDTNTWLNASDLNSHEQQEIISIISRQTGKVKRDMQIHERFGSIVMLRRMCLAIAFID